jgi:hypothetical protein
VVVVEVAQQPQRASQRGVFLQGLRGTGLTAARKACAWAMRRWATRCARTPRLQGQGFQLLELVTEQGGAVVALREPGAHCLGLLLGRRQAR